MIYKVSTTGIVSEVVLYDMGERTLTHPTVELDLGLEYTEDELLSSEDLVTAISNDWLHLDEKSGGTVTSEEVVAISTTVAQNEILNTNSDIDGGSAVTVFDDNETIDGGEAVTF